jgi:hypothetical protein
MDTRRRPARLRFSFVLLATVAFVVAGTGRERRTVTAQTNPIVTENMEVGTPQSEWDVSGSGDPAIQGFATDISVNKGSTVNFKIKLGADVAGYVIDIYRLGFYQGFGARHIATITPTDQQIEASRNQPDCLRDPSAGLVDCGNWGISGTFPTTGVTSGIFIARPRRTVGNGASHIVFIVRDDTRKADILFQTSDTTWQAYNQYPGLADGGSSLYCNGPFDNSAGDYACPGRSAKVSYNRPFDTRDHDKSSWLFNAEYPMVRWMEANGYDLKYWSGVDTDRLGADPAIGLRSGLAPKAFFSVGHDEYWSGPQRANVENARNGGVNLAFFSGNEMFWKTRYESSIDGSSTGYRTLVSYKETFTAGTSRIDPNPANPWTGTWRDTRFSPQLDGGRPENALTGTLWTVNCCSDKIVIPSEFKNLRFWRNTAVAALLPGEVYVTSPDVLGYEWDEDIDNGFRPAGLMRMSSTTILEPSKVLDFGINVGPGTATHSLTLYRHNSGALVFGAGTVQWSWGLDAMHDQVQTSPDRAVQQATVNLLADMGVQPLSLQRGADNQMLLSASMSGDIFAPTTSVIFPAAGASVSSGSHLTITGQATERGGGAVAGVEVSVDGSTWHPALMPTPTTFAYDWQPGAVGQATIRTRAIDDSGNLEAAAAGIGVNIVPGDCPCTTLWKPSAAPAVASAADANPVELGLKFFSDSDGFITGVRFYKGPANNSTHVGNLWSASGTLLATAVFVNETATGWQEVLFPSPVSIAANTTYVISYHTNVGGYAADAGYLLANSVDSPPLHAASSAGAGGNGLFGYGETQFPTQTFNAANYWVDVVFAPSLIDATPPVVSRIKPAIVDSSRVTITWTTDELSTSKIEISTDPALLISTTTLPPGTVTINQSAFVLQHSVALTGLTPNTTYYYRVISVDRSGNAANVAAPSFTVPGPTLRDTSATDFAAGTIGATYVSENGDGEVMLAPAAGTEFSGSALDSNWTAVPWDVGGFARVANGTLLVDGSRVGTCVTILGGCAETANLSPGHRLEFVATFSGDAFQHAGFGQTIEPLQPFAIFSTDRGGTLEARSLNGSLIANDEIINGPAYLGSPHRYAIDWQADRIDYYIDGALVKTHAFAIPGPMRPIAASDFSVFGGTILVNWMRLSPYSLAGAFESRVFDASATADWQTIQWHATTPPGTAVAISLRVGDTAVPGAGWTEWQSIAAPGALALHSRYIQYRAELATTDANVTPTLDDIIISTDRAPVAAADAIIVPQNGVSTLPPTGLGSLVANDLDADGDPLEVVAVGPASHGTVALLFDGSVRYTPQANYNGPDQFVYTVSDGLLTATAPVSIDVRFGNIPPVANNDVYSIDEDASLSVPVAAGLLKNDTDADHDVLTVVLATLPQHGLLTLNALGGFSYTPSPNYAGPDVFTYKAFDSQATSEAASVTINVLPVNDPPLTQDDAFTAVLNVPLTVAAARGVLANDRDIELEDTAPLRAQLLSQPANGTLVLNGDGSFAYTPNADFLGIDSFTYAAVDHFNAVGNTATVAITVALRAIDEGVNGGGTVSTAGGVTPTEPLASAVTLPSAGTVRIVEGVIAGSEPPAGFTFMNRQVNITILNPDGTEMIASAASPIRIAFAIDGTLLLPGENKSNVEVFRNGVRIPDCLGETAIPAANADPCVTARDGDTAPNSDVRITILSSHASKWNMGRSSADLGTAPHALDDGVYQVDFQTPLIVAASGVLGNDYGRHGLTAVLVANSEAGGSVVLKRSGGFVFTPGTGVCGAASFRYVANDGIESSNEATVAIQVDCRPQANGDAISVFEDSGMNTITVLSNDTDPDPNQPLTVTSVTRPAHGLASIVVAGGPTAVNYAPDANFFGADSFDYTISDGRGGTSTATVSVNVAAVNDAPSFTPGANQSVNEDALPQSIAGWATGVSAGPANESAQTVDFLVSTDNAALFASQPAVSPAGALTFTPALDANGVATVTVKAHDNGGFLNGGIDTSVAQTFTIAVAAVNDAPSFKPGPDQNVSEDAGAQSVPNWATAISAGPADEAKQTVAFTIIGNSNPNLFLVPPAVSPDGTLTYTLAANVSGTSKVTVVAKDTGGGADTSAQVSFVIAVAGVNDAPSFTKGANLTVLEDAGPRSIAAWGTAISAGPADESGQTLNFIVSNTNNALFSAQPVVSPAGTLTFTPAPNGNGVATVTVQVHDSGGVLNGGVDTSADQTFTITVTAVNDIPSFTLGLNQAVKEDAGPQSVLKWATNLSAGPANESAQALSFIVSNENNALFTAAGQPAVDANGTLTFTTAPDANGSVKVNVQIHDTAGVANGGADTSAIQTFAIDIAPVNDNPAAAADTATLLEDSTATTIDVLANDSIVPDTGETLSVTAVTQGGHGSVKFTTTSVTYSPLANYNGADSFTYTIGDGNGGTATAIVNVTVSAVNDAPSFARGADQTSAAGAGAQTVAAWATRITAGPTDEAGQTLTFALTTDNAALFAAQPAIDANGTLTYTPASTGGGIAHLTATLTDNGGVADGGVDTSAPATFSIVVPFPTTTTLTSPTASPTAYGQAVILNATVTSAGGTATGSIDFLDGTALLGSVALTNGSASLTTTAIGVGTARTIKGVYRPAVGFLTSEASITRAVTAVATTSTFAATPPTAQYSDVVTFETTLKPGNLGGTLPAQQAQFKIGTLVIGTANFVWDATAGVARAKYTGPLVEPTFTPTGGALRPGSKTVTITYLGVNPNYTVANKSSSMSITREDAVVAYAGDTKVVCTTCSAVAVQLRARVSEADASVGDVRNATVSFVNRTTGLTIATVAVAADGTASTTWTVNLGTSATQTTKIGMVVSGYYIRSNTLDDGTVVVSKQ